MSRRRHEVVVVGAGVAGLTLASRLLDRGHSVTVLERAPAVGGLARSFRYGEFVFDVGPHRFHTYDDSARRFIQQVLGRDALEIGRRSAVYLFGKYLEWPLNLRALAAIPLRTQLRILGDLAQSRGDPPGERFSDLIRARYGETLYQLFFKPYTERLVKLSCDELAREWAETAIERALIDRGIKATSIVELARSALLPRTPLRFVYPAGGGMGVFSERLAAQVREAGGAVVTEAPVEAALVEPGRVRAVVAAGREYPCDTLFWTASLTDVLGLLGGPALALRYLSLVLFNYEVAEATAARWQWCYFSDAAVPFSRVSIPARFDPALAPRGNTGLCVEVSAMVGDPVWAAPETIDDAIRAALCRTGVVRDPRSLGAVHVEHVADAWPLYTLGFRAEHARGLEFMARFPNVRLVGRNASFWYNNADHSIAAALRQGEKPLEPD